MNTFVIAEAGSTHDGSVRKALDLVEAARDAGCDAVKFQWWSDPDRLGDRRRVPDAYREIYYRYQVPLDWLELLRETALARTEPTMGRRPLAFLCTAYLPEDVHVVEPFVEQMKIASFEAGDADFVHRNVFTGKPVLISAGMLSADDPRLEHLRLVRESHPGRVQLLHCISSYPAPLDAMHLAALSALGFDGLSDHSRQLLTGAVAVGAGARIIEAHLRLPTTSPQNPDFATAFHPEEFAAYVRNIRVADALMGSSERPLQACEREMAAYRVQPS